MTNLSSLPRPSAKLFFELLDSLPAGELERLPKAAETALYRMWVTFGRVHRAGSEEPKAVCRMVDGFVGEQVR